MTTPNQPSLDDWEKEFDDRFGMFDTDIQISGCGDPEHCSPVYASSNDVIAFIRSLISQAEERGIKKTKDLIQEVIIPQAKDQGEEEGRQEVFKDILVWAEECMSSKFPTIAFVAGIKKMREKLLTPQKEEKVC